MKMTETELLGYALVGYQVQPEEIQRRIDDVQRRLTGAAAEVEPRPKHRLSPEGRRRLIAATRKRWRHEAIVRGAMARVRPILGLVQPSIKCGWATIAGLRYSRSTTWLA